MIISGFAGIGKTTLAHNTKGVIDLESTPFEKDWDRYIKVAKHMHDNGYIVLVSSHIELRQQMLDNNIPYVYVLPVKELKSEYLKRYQERGNDDTFISMMDKSFDVFVAILKGEDVYALLYKHENLTNQLENIKEMFKERNNGKK